MFISSWFVAYVLVPVAVCVVFRYDMWFEHEYVLLCGTCVYIHTNTAVSTLYTDRYDAAVRG